TVTGVPPVIGTRTASPAALATRTCVPAESVEKKRLALVCKSTIDAVAGSIEEIVRLVDPDGQCAIRKRVATKRMNGKQNPATETFEKSVVVDEPSTAPKKISAEVASELAFRVART